jgi:magnesium-transporting ATPase (P-type)
MKDTCCGAFGLVLLCATILSLFGVFVLIVYNNQMHYSKNIDQYKNITSKADVQNCIECNDEELEYFKYNFFSSQIGYSFGEWWTCLNAIAWIIFFLISPLSKNKDFRIFLCVFAIICIIVYYVGWAMWMFDRAPTRIQVPFTSISMIIGLFVGLGLCSYCVDKMEREYYQIEK